MHSFWRASSDQRSLEARVAEGVNIGYDESAGLVGPRINGGNLEILLVISSLLAKYAYFNRGSCTVIESTIPRGSELVDLNSRI